MLVTALTLPIEPENMPIMLETELSTSLNASAPTFVSWTSNALAAPLRRCGGVTNTRRERLRGRSGLAMDAGSRGRAGPGRRKPDRRGTAPTQIGANHLPPTGCGAHLIRVNI
jgi:hypothetical protein